MPANWQHRADRQIVKQGAVSSCRVQKCLYSKLLAAGIWSKLYFASKGSHSHHCTKAEKTEMKTRTEQSRLLLQTGSYKPSCPRSLPEIAFSSKKKETSSIHWWRQLVGVKWHVQSCNIRDLRAKKNILVELLPCCCRQDNPVVSSGLAAKRTNGSVCCTWIWSHVQL